MRGRGTPRSCLATKGTHTPNSCPLSASPAPPPTPTAQPCSETHLGRWALQGVAVQQNDLQVPEAAEGDRDAGDTVTGEIQADKRKVPQLWGWVREKSDACSGAGPCAHFLCPLLWLACHLSSSPLCPGGRRAPPRNHRPAPLPTQTDFSCCPSASPPCPLHPTATSSSSSVHHRTQIKL